MAGAALLFLLAALASLNAGSYFLQFDNPTDHLAGLIFSRGQWAYSGNRAIVMWILGGANHLLGASPYNEAIITTVLGMCATAALYDLALVAFRSPRTAALSVIVWVSLGSVLFYFRVHTGFALAFFTLALPFYARRRFFVAGVFLLLALVSHTSFVVPLALLIGITTLMGTGPRTFSEAVLLAAPIVAGYLGYEYVALRYTTELWHTTRNFLTEIHKLNSPLPDRPPDVIWLLYKSSNGAPAAWAMTFALGVYPVLRRRDNRLLDALTAVAVILIGFYVFRGSILKQTVVLRVLAASLPVLALLVANLLDTVLYHLKTASRMTRALACGLLAVSLPLHLLLVLIGINASSTTAYPAIHRAIVQAHEEGRPVVFFGIPAAGAYFRLLTGATVILNPQMGPVASETANPVTLADLPTGTPVTIISLYDEAPEDTLARVEAVTGVRMTGEPATGIPHPAFFSPVALPEDAAPSIAGMRAANLLTFAHETSYPEAFVWLGARD